MSVTKAVSRRSFSILFVLAAGLACTQAGLAQPNLIQDPSFEGTPPGVWQESSAQGFDVVTDTGFPVGVTPRTGSFLAWLGGAEEEFSEVWQVVAIPADAESGVLSWYQWILSDDIVPDDAGFEAFVGDTAVFSLDLSPEDDTIGWVPESAVVDLTPYAGTSAEIGFAAVTFDDLTSVLIDDVSFQLAGDGDGGVPVIPAPPAVGLVLFGLSLLGRRRLAGLR